MLCVWEGAVNVLTLSPNRPGAHGQQHGVFDLASGEHDQSEKLLHVCLLLSFLRLVRYRFGITFLLKREPREWLLGRFSMD